jgi:hypothetical protein
MGEKWTCRICGKENCWHLFEINHSPPMCFHCWEKWRMFEGGEMADKIIKARKEDEEN